MDSELQSEKVAQLRKRFLEEFEANRDQYDECDLKKINGDLWVARFLNFLDQGEDKAFEHMKDAFRWRKSFGINEFDRTTIPLEVYQMCPIFQYERDGKGRPSLIVRDKMHRKIPVIEERFKKSFINFIERVDATADQEFGWNLIFDCQGAGYQNADLDMVLFIMPTIRRYFPNGVRYVYLVGLPWMLSNMIRVAMAFMPADTRKKIRSITQAELHERFPLSSLPDFLGGTCKKNYRLIPKGARTCADLAKELYNLTESDTRRIMRPSTKYIEEGAKLAEFEP